MAIPELRMFYFSDETTKKAEPACAEAKEKIRDKATRFHRLDDPQARRASGLRRAWVLTLSLCGHQKDRDTFFFPWFAWCMFLFWVLLKGLLEVMFFLERLFLQLQVFEVWNPG